MDATHINTTTENEHVKALSVQKSANQSKFTSKTKEKTDTKAFILFYGDVTINTSLRHHD